MSGMSTPPPRKAAQVGSLEMAVVAGTWLVPNIFEAKLGSRSL